MKFTCLSKGGGFHFPPCHMLNFCGFRILFDCPVDLSALTIFSPVPTGFDSFPDEESCDFEFVTEKRQKVEKPLGANSLIRAEPWYKTVKSLHLWNISQIDVILISSPMGMLGLPFLTRMKGFSSKVYVTEASARLGQLMMDDLVSMHVEFRQFYGCEDSGFPQWLRHEELELLPPELREVVLGKDGTELGGWMPLYSAADVKDCMQKSHKLKYAEEVYYNGILAIKAFSSGLEIGSCNWIINAPKRDIVYISSSTFVSAHAMTFNYCALQGINTIIYSDFSSLRVMGDVEDENNYFPQTADKLSSLSSQELAESSLNMDEHLEEREKLGFICSCALECVKAGGSVLVPTNRLGTLLQLLEQISALLESSAMEVSIYIISSVADELLAFLNVIPEWLCKQRQERLFSGEQLFAHVELIRRKKLHVVPAVHSSKLLTNWQEPCIVFSPHWTMRFGPVVHLLRRWCGNPNSLLILEDGFDPKLALLPFEPIAMKVLQCVFPSGLKLQKVEPLIKTLLPKIVLFPEDLKPQISLSNAKSFSVFHYTEDDTLHVPCQKDSSVFEIATDLASQFHWKKLMQENFNISRLKGELSIDHGKYHLLVGKEQGSSSKHSSLLHWGSPDVQKLLAALSKMGINGSLEQGISDTESETVHVVHVQDYKGLIKVGTRSTVISAADESLASLIFEAVDSVLDGI
ncbi:Integrator complex subunit 9 [Quillaja saponaria]|uniref:Integrator complex subunit 9 n=1 Tax=Quillaja saponaria TaxID=32244 RepID=A0AAD7L0R2_QUISA|nr:Integrator complex subunit 9 [Quillaja saponaria]